MFLGSQHVAVEVVSPPSRKILIVCRAAPFLESRHMPITGGSMDYHVTDPAMAKAKIGDIKRGVKGDRGDLGSSRPTAELTGGRLRKYLLRMLNFLNGT
jgi:hypothetical protein